MGNLLAIYLEFMIYVSTRAEGAGEVQYDSGTLIIEVLPTQRVRAREKGG